MVTRSDRTHHKKKKRSIKFQIFIQNQDGTKTVQMYYFERPGKCNLQLRYIVYLNVFKLVIS